MFLTSQLNAALIRKLRGSLICMAYVLTCHPWCLYNQALADVRSTGAWIECLYWIFPLQGFPTSRFWHSNTCTSHSTAEIFPERRLVSFYFLEFYSSEIDDFDCKL